MQKEHVYKNDFFKWFNWRQIVFNFIAFWFYIFSFHIFSYLRDLRKYEAILAFNRGEKEIYESAKEKYFPYDSTIDWQTNSIYFGLFGLAIAFLISILISKKTKRYWINSFIAFVIIFSLWCNNALGWKIIRDYFAQFRDIFSSNFLGLFINGLLLLLIGSFFLFSKWSSNFSTTVQVQSK